MKTVINLEDLEYRAFGKGEKFQAERCHVSPLVGAKKLGYGVVRLQPGKCAWPYHAHHAIEEFFYIISGEGTLRHADEKHPIRAGDFIAAPADPAQPHQIINTSDDELVYIALSNEMTTDVMVYPDSGKYGVWHGDASDFKAPGNFIVFARKEDAVDYYDGEVDDD